MEALGVRFPAMGSHFFPDESVVWCTRSPLGPGQTALRISTEVKVCMTQPNLMNGVLEAGVAQKGSLWLEGNSSGALQPAHLFMASPEFTAEHWAENLLNMIYQQPQKSPWSLP